MDHLSHRLMGGALSASATSSTSRPGSPSKRKDFKFFFDDDDDDNSSTLPTTTVNTNQKLSKLSTIFGSIVIVAATVLFMLNNWHATKCSSSKTSEEIADYIESLKDRLLEAESQAIRNELIISSTLKELEKKLYGIETKKIQSLTGFVDPQINELGLALGLQKSPFHATFDLDPKYHDRKIFEELIDEVFNNYEDIKSISHVTSAQTSVEYTISSVSAPSNDVSGSQTNLSSSEVSALCNKWLVEYAVMKGHSWGFLPYDLQSKWVEYNCDNLTDIPPDAV